MAYTAGVNATWLRPIAIGLLAAFWAEGCSGSEEPAPKPGACSSEPAPTLEAVDAAVTVHLDAPADAATAILKSDLESYLGAAWGVPVSVADGAPQSGPSVWLTTSDAAKSELGVSIDSGYVLRRVDGAAPRWIVYAPDTKNLAYGTYAFLEELGFRFFHPKQELVPQLGKPVLPRALDATRKPAFRVRGLQPHILHPIEWLEPLAEPSPENLADAKLLVDWLVKTGQNHLQWPLLAYEPFSEYAAHVSAIADHAKTRGVRLGAVVQMFGAAALQNNYVLVEDEANWQAELEAGIDELMTVSWDAIVLALGEFVGNDPSEIITWLNHATAYVSDNYPGVEVSVQVHVGNYAGLWVDYQGQETFFYHLAGEADPRLTSSVHTVYLFDLYRDWGTYKHENFFLQREYLFAELGERKVEYFPESAYWIAADVDVPLFLPEFIYARWLDISSLSRDIAAKGLPALDGHIMFSSGHEWNYWLTDYLAAKQLWNPEATFSETLVPFSSAFGACASDVQSAVEGLTNLQNEYLFDQRLIGYVTGEDNTLDVGWLAGYESHPRRKSYKEVAELEPAARTEFLNTVVVPLETMADGIEVLEKKLASRCATADAALEPWCDELVDGFAIDRLRARHSALLYRAVLDSADGGSEHPALLERAVAERTAAKDVVDRRSQGYRFDVSRLVDSYKNRTIYSFGYLRQAHTLCFWIRQEEQAKTWIETGYEATVAGLPTCHD